MAVVRTPRLPEDLLTYKEAEALLGVSRSTLQRMISRHDIDTIVISGRPRILRPSISAYLRRQLVAG